MLLHNSRMHGYPEWMFTKYQNLRRKSYSLFNNLSDLKSIMVKGVREGSGLGGWRHKEIRRWRANTSPAWPLTSVTTVPGARVPTSLMVPNIQHYSTAECLPAGSKTVSSEMQCLVTYCSVSPPSLQKLVTLAQQKWRTRKNEMDCLAE